MIDFEELDIQSLKILTIIWRAPNKELRWKDIRARMPKTTAKGRSYKWRSLSTILQRKLDKLFGSRILERRRQERKTFYDIPKNLWSQVRKSIRRLELFNVPTKMLHILHNLMNRMALEGKDPEEFIQKNCIAFIGSIPCTFPKSNEGMEQWLRFEKTIKRRALKKGLPKEQYFEELLAQVKKEEGIQKLLTFYGLTKEDIRRAGGYIGPIKRRHRNKEEITK